MALDILNGIIEPTIEVENNFPSEHQDEFLHLASIHVRRTEDKSSWIRSRKCWLKMSWSSVIHRIAILLFWKRSRMEDLVFVSIFVDYRISITEDATVTFLRSQDYLKELEKAIIFSTNGSTVEILKDPFTPRFPRIDSVHRTTWWYLSIQGNAILPEKCTDYFPVLNESCCTSRLCQQIRYCLLR